MIGVRFTVLGLTIEKEDDLEKKSVRKKGFEVYIAMKTEIITGSKKPLSPDLLGKMDAYWRAANYLSVGQIYLYDNPLLKRPLTLADVKHMLLGHWGTTPGQNFIYVHLNRVIKKI